MNFRDININKANRLLDILDIGEYKSSNDILVKIPEFYDADYFTPVESESLLDYDLSNFSIRKNTIEVSSKSAVDVVISEHQNNPNAKIGILNFASAKHPGGGFITGAMAQEEALCHASTLYRQLEHSQLYIDNGRTRLSGLYNNAMNVSDTYFIANSRGNLIDNPVIATVVTSAAVNNRHLGAYEKTHVKKVMQKRMEIIIRMFIKEECNIIILGAFGCGVFLNDPVFVANTWKGLLNKYKYFDRVVFSVLDRDKNNNLQIFKDTFK